MKRILLGVLIGLLSPGWLFPPSVQAGDLSTILAQIKTPDTAAVDAAERKIIAAGPAVLPAVREAISSRRTALAKPGGRPLVETQLLQLQLGALEGAQLALVWGVHPREVIGQFLARVPVNKSQGWVASARPARIVDDAVARTFPGHQFYVLHISAYPVARPLPEPLVRQNLFIVAKDGKLEHVTDAGALERQLRQLLAPARDDGARRATLRAWLRLTQEFSQDTMFVFAIPDDSLKVVSENTAWKATGKAVVEPTGGNRGEIIVSLWFDSEGVVTTVSETRNVRAGIRPYCQATKLLDPDPIVRRMAEQDIRVMGRAAAAYLAERHALAPPDLQAAIEAAWQRILADD